MLMETKQNMGWGRGLNPFPESPKEDSSRSECAETEEGFIRQAAATSTQKIPLGVCLETGRWSSWGPPKA